MSRWLTKWWVTGVLVLSGSSGVLADAPYAPPTPNVVAFRRDRLPLDPDTISDLSQQLLVLAKNQGGVQPTDRRTVAQILATALVLTPDDPKLTAFGERFATGERTPVGDPEAVATARARVWQILGWLDAKNAGDDAHTLAACLSDIMVAADPKHPKAQELATRGERGPWDGWVRSLDAFKIPDPLAKNDPHPIATPDPKATENPTDDSDPTDKPVKLAKAKLQSVVWANLSLNQPRSLTVLPFTMDAALRPAREERAKDSTSEEDDKPSNREPKPFSCRWENPKAGEQAWEESERFNPLCEAIQKAVKDAGGELPDDVRMTIRAETTASYRIAKDPAGLSAPLAVLMHAMGSGVEPSGTVIGEIAKDGSFKAPADFWQRLRHLSGKTVGRLIVPAEAEPFLSALLVLEEPGFFLDNEVIFASNLEELLEFSARTPAGTLADPSARFQEIRSKRGNQAVSAYVANRFIRTRLDEIARAAPCHASARMLAIQGAGQRPTRLTTHLLATELLAITAPVAPFAAVSEPDKLDAETMLGTFEAGKDKAEALMRYAEMRDRALVDQANDLMVGLRTFARSLRKKTDSEGRAVNHYGDLKNFKELHDRITGALKLAASAAP